MDEVILGIKGLMLLKQSDIQIQTLLHERLINSHDEEIKGFLGLLTNPPSKRGRGSLGTAVGEMLLAAVLILAGVATIAPVVIGLNTPQALIQYIGQLTVTVVSQQGLYFVVELVDLILSIALLTAAFYALRRAAQDLKDAGVSVALSEN